MGVKMNEIPRVWAGFCMVLGKKKFHSLFTSSSSALSSAICPLQCNQKFCLTFFFSLSLSRLVHRAIPIPIVPVVVNISHIVKRAHALDVHA